MKKLYILALVVLALFSGCKKDDVLSNTFSATIENDGAKTTLNGHKVFWVKDVDKITVNGTELTCSEVKTNKTQATFATNVSVTPNDSEPRYKAYYPSNTVSASRTYNPADGNFSEIPMYAESNDHNLVFKNCFNVLELTLTANKTVKAIFVTSDKDLAGSFLVNNDIASLEGSNLKTLTMYCGEGVDISSGKKFYFPIVPDDDHRLTIQVLDIDGNVATIHSSQHIYLRNRIYQVPVTLNNWEAPSYGHFTIDNQGHQVRFAPGNLRYSGGTFSFLPHQYDYGGGVTNDWNQANYQGYFAWDSSSVTSHPGGLLLGKFKGGNVGTFDSQPEWPGVEGAWFILSKDEWKYAVGINAGDKRPGSTINGTSNRRYARVSVTGIKGLLLVPDNATIPNIQFLNNISWNNSTANFNDKNFTLDQWLLLEFYGCVFLPTAGQYSLNSRREVGYSGMYWTRTSDPDNSDYNKCEYILFFSGGPYTFLSMESLGADQGYSVRLVQPWRN